MLIQLIYKNIHLKYHIGNNYCAPGASRKCFINSCFSVCPPICLPSVTSFPPNFFISFFFFFPKILHNDTQPDLEKIRKYRFFRKILIWLKMGNMGPKSVFWKP